MTKRRAPNPACRRLHAEDYGPPRPRDWYAARFIFHPLKTQTTCEECGRPMWLPASRVAMYRTCSEGCRRARREVARAARKRDCETCSRPFIPRATQLTAGIGRYCSRSCIPTDRLSTPENLAKAQKGSAEARAEGRIKPLRGSENGMWKGGDQICRAARNRVRVESGASAAYTRQWRHANPDRTKEQSQRRHGRKIGRLPYGTVPRIRKAQRDRCAICSDRLLGRGHLDHIRPLARGGEHAPHNLQLLCGPCNVRKSAKDPLDYMRELGRLL